MPFRELLIVPQGMVGSRKFSSYDDLIAIQDLSVTINYFVERMAGSTTGFEFFMDFRGFVRFWVAFEAVGSSAGAARIEQSWDGTHECQLLLSGKNNQEDQKALQLIRSRLTGPWIDEHQDLSGWLHREPRPLSVVFSRLPHLDRDKSLDLIERCLAAAFFHLCGVA